jgi:site-specific recombinase
MEPSDRDELKIFKELLDRRQREKIHELQRRTEQLEFLDNVQKELYEKRLRSEEEERYALVEELKKELEERERTIDEMDSTLFRLIEEGEALRRRCEELYISRREAALMFENVNGQIQDLYNKVGQENYQGNEHRLEMEDMNQWIQELEKKERVREETEANLEDTDSDKKKVDSTRCDKMKKLVAVTVVVGAVVAAGWWFLS